MMHKELRAMIICVWYDYFNIMHILAAVLAPASLGSLCTRPRLRQHIKRGGGNCSVSDTINTLGGGPDASKTLSTVEDNCGGITS